MTLLPKLGKVKAAGIWKNILAALGVIVLLNVFFVTFGYVNLSDGEFTPPNGSENSDYAMVLQHYTDFKMSGTNKALRLDKEKEVIRLGDKPELKITANVYPINLKDNEIKWTSSDTEIAVVDANGNVSAKKTGKAVITAQLVKSGIKANTEIEVIQPVTGIFMPTTTVVLYKDGIGKLLKTEIYPKNATNTKIKWTSKDSKVVTVDETGRIKPKNVGMTEVIATTEDGGFESKCFVTVANYSEKVSSVLIQNKPSEAVKAGSSYNFITIVSPQNAKDKTLKWVSSNPEVATVSQTGKVRTLKEGKTSITVTSSNGKKDSCEISVLKNENDASTVVDGVKMITASASSKDISIKAAANAITGQDIDFSGKKAPQDGTVTYVPYNISLMSLVNIQMGLSPQPKIWKNGGHTYATMDEVAEYMNPAQFIEGSYKYQFLDLSQSNGVTADALNVFLEDKGILKGQGEAFIEASRENNISEIYLVIHACLETGNGTSQLSTGVNVNGTTVYNVFGIAAYDDSAVYSGSQKAYKEGWTSPAAAIKGGAAWISRWYINSPDGRQNTLYKMLWNPDKPGEHQYATDIGWAVKQTASYEKIFASFPEAVKSYEVPVYEGMSTPVLEQ